MTPERLSLWLTARGIKTDAWGQHGYKRVADLAAEIVAGETVLHDHPPRRQVRVVQVIVQRDDQILIEVAQIMLDGSRRPRRLPPSEKMLPGEAPADAARRCLIEELGVAADAITLQPHPPTPAPGEPAIDGASADDAPAQTTSAGVTSADPFAGPPTLNRQLSLSYPTLLTEYAVYTVRATVDGLPPGAFMTREAAAGKKAARGAASADPVTLHFWRWEPLEVHFPT